MLRCAGSVGSEQAGRIPAGTRSLAARSLSGRALRVKTHAPRAPLCACAPRVRPSLIIQAGCNVTRCHRMFVFNAIRHTLLTKMLGLVHGPKLLDGIMDKAIPTRRG